MKILPINNNYNQNFRSTLMPTRTLEKAFDFAEEKANKKFLVAVKSLLNDKQKRTIELTSGYFVSRDGVRYIKTKMMCNDEKKEYIAFPKTISVDEAAAKDAQLLLIELANVYGNTEYDGVHYTEIKTALKELKNKIFTKK